MVLRLRRLADRTGFVAVSVGVVVTGFVQGTTTVSIPFSGLGGPDIVLLNATVACLLFSGTLLLSGVVFVVDVLRDGDSADPPTSGPNVAAIVPIYGDASILHRSVESLLESNYENLHVYVVCEPGDTETIDRAESLAQHERVDCLVNTHDPGSKAAAIDFAAAVTESEYLGVFDADERVHPAFVSAAVAGLESHDVVQGRTVPRPNGPFESIAYYESILLGYLTHRLLGLLTNFRMATSNVILMRREAFERVGGYDPQMLTEDFDFAFRCYEAGLDVDESLSFPSEIEAAHTPTDWWGQRKRWMTGYAQVFHRRLAALHPIAVPRSLPSLLVCAGAIFGNLFLLSLVPQVVVLVAIGAETVLAVLLSTVWGVALAVRWLDARAGYVDSLGIGWLLVPFVLPLYSLAGIKGIVEYPLSWSGEWYRVTKGT